MTRRYWTARISLVATALLLTVTVSPSAEAETCEKFCTEADEITARMSDVAFMSVPSRPNPKRYLYSDSCYIEEEVRTADGCINGSIPPPGEACATGTWVEPRWSQIRETDDGQPGPWILEAGYTCPGDVDFPIQLEDFTRLPIEPSPLELQPRTGWVYAGLDTIAYTDDSAQGFSVTLLDIPFDVGAVPIEYVWDFGDGSEPLVTKESGSPWPDYTIGHKYTASGTATPILTTHWKGVYRRSALEPWQEIPGTGETVTTGTELTIYTARTRLVEDDLN